MRDSGLLGLRLTLGGYLMAHGAQKLFGALDGPGLDNVATHFHSIGLRPGRAMAPLAGVSEFVGGLLTATGLAYPVGPIALAGAMVVATTVHGDKGPMALKGGYELALTNVAAALALAATGPGRYSLDALHGRRVPKRLVALTVLGGAALTAYNAAGVVRSRRDQNPAPLPAGSANGSGPAAPAAAPEAAVSATSAPVDATVTES